MNESIAKLLEPISAAQPCGPDLSYDPRFDQLETIVLGKPEVEIGSHKTAAEPPDWRELKDRSIDFLSHSKHLRVGVMLSCSLLRTDGLAGFVDGLELLHGLLERFWSGIYPLLDPDDNNDPTQRLNILSTLSPRREAMGLGWLTILDYLYSAPLCQPKGGAPVSFEQLQAAKQRPTSGDTSAPPAASAPELAKLEIAIRAAGSTQAASSHDLLALALAALNRIDTFLTTTLGAGNTISFESLQKALEQIQLALKPYLPGGSPTAAASPSTAPESSRPATVAGSAMTITGSIRSREDVAHAIDIICEYYRQVEPSSPVPYLLRRAQKLAAMNFVQAVQELNLGSIDTLRPSLGSALEPSSPTPGEAPAERVPES